MGHNKTKAASMAAVDFPASPLVGLGSLLLAWAAWTAGLQRYHGAGS